jgi:hypothetical protein
LQDIIKDPMLREQRAHCAIQRHLSSQPIKPQEEESGPSRVEILEDENAKLRTLSSRTFSDLRAAIDPIAPDEQYYMYDLSAVPLDWVIEELSEDMKHCTDIVAEALLHYQIINN